MLKIEVIEGPTEATARCKDITAIGATVKEALGALVLALDEDRKVRIRRPPPDPDILAKILAGAIYHGGTSEELVWGPVDMVELLRALPPDLMLCNGFMGGARQAASWAARTNAAGTMVYVQRLANRGPKPLVIFAKGVRLYTEVVTPATPGYVAPAPPPAKPLAKGRRR